MTKIQHGIESYAIEENALLVFGWAHAAGEPVEIGVTPADDTAGFSVDRNYRADINREYPGLGEDYEAGFRLVVSFGARGLKGLFPLRISFTSPGAQTRGELVEYRDVKNLAIKRKKGPLTLIKKAAETFRDEGIGGVIYKTRRKLGIGREFSNVDYEEWMAKAEPSDKELQIQRTFKWKRAPLISICVPAYRTDRKLLEAMTDSCIEQTYSNWELCIADGSGDGSLTETLKEIAAKDGRIRFKTLDENQGISGNTNAALEMAKGELIAFMDHDDILSPDALFAVCAAWDEDNTREFIYSDQDMLSFDGTKRYEPSFKPDFNLDFLRSVNYICHLHVITAGLYKKVGGLNKEFDGAQDYDYILRCVEQAQNIYHIPKILYHWRATPDSVAGNQDSKQYAFDAGKRAIEAHYKRLGIKAAVHETSIKGNYRTIYHIEGEPLVSIIIPNKDHSADLKRCISSIMAKNTYKNTEIVIVENNSEDEATFDYYRSIKNMAGIKLIRYKGGFNFSAINNYAVARAAGEYLLFLNNDTELIDSGMIEEMLSFCMREGTGAVGAKLLYDNDTVQHAGVIVGLGGVAGHAFLGIKKNEPGYANRAVSAMEMSAVTAACMMTSRRAFEAAGGFDEMLTVAFNDVDLCMAIRREGYSVVYDPYAMAYHYESRSRGYESSREKMERFGREIEYFRDKWKAQLMNGDPFYNPNLTLRTSDFSLRV